MNKVLFALLFVSVSFGSIPMAFAGKKAKKEDDKQIVGVQKKITNKDVNKNSRSPVKRFQPKRNRRPSEKALNNMPPYKRSFFEHFDAIEQEGQRLDKMAARN